MAGKNGNNGPKCPSTDRLEELMDFLTHQKNTQRGSDTDLESPSLMPHEEVAITQRNETLQEIVEALDWLHTMLSNRKSYHQKRQAESKIFMELARKTLSQDEIDAIKKQAERMINNG